MLHTGLSAGGAMLRINTYLGPFVGIQKPLSFKCSLIKNVLLKNKWVVSISVSPHTIYLTTRGSNKQQRFMCFNSKS